MDAWSAMAMTFLPAVMPKVLAHIAYNMLRQIKGSACLRDFEQFRQRPKSAEIGTIIEGGR
jgi:hypothetical protein